MVAISESGIVTRLIRATRHSKRNRNKITTTSRKPSTNASRRLWIAVSMNLACWKMWVSNWTPCMPGCRSLMTFSTSRVTLDESAHGSFSTTSSRPGPSPMTASPMSGWCVSAT